MKKKGNIVDQFDNRFHDRWCHITKVEANSILRIGKKVVLLSLVEIDNFIDNFIEIEIDNFSPIFVGNRVAGTILG